jgi:hypothetical protein
MAAVREVPQRVSKFHFSKRKTQDRAYFGHPKFTLSICLDTEKVLIPLWSAAITEKRFHLLLCWTLRHFSSTRVRCFSLLRHRLLISCHAITSSMPSQRVKIDLWQLMSTNYKTVQVYEYPNCFEFDPKTISLELYTHIILYLL